LDTTEITNSYPPRVTLAFLGMFQSGLALLVEGPLRALMQRRLAWTVVVGVSARIMTLYLWHLTAMVFVIGLSLAAGGFGLGIEPLTAGWWLSRPVWFLVVGVATMGMVAIFGRFESPVEDTRPAPAWWRPVLAVVGICAGLGLLAAIGIADEQGLNGLVLSLPIIAVIIGGVFRIPGRGRSPTGSA
jgi:peptidoglycan/LPS O-acetylase OafA/YrhL